MKALFAALLLLATATLPGCINDILPTGPTRPQDYLQDDKYEEWVVEVDYVGGKRPDQSVLDFVRGRLSPLVHKPAGLTFTVDDQLPAKNGAWTTDQLLAFSQDHRDIKNDGNTITTHLLFVNGGSSSDTPDAKVLGVAIGFDVVVIFVDNINASCRPLAVPPCTYTQNEMQRVVTLHEFGHILGLVNRKAGDGSIPVPQQSQHEDPQHKGHSRNQNSVMYWAVESSVIGDIFRGGDLPDTFDAEDKKDLCAAGGRC